MGTVSVRKPRYPQAVLLPLSRRPAASSMAQRACALVAIAIVFMAATRIAHAEELAPTEYQVKSAFLYNFAKFVEWPAEAFGDELTPLNLCVLGDEHFVSARESLAGKKVKGRKLEVNRVETAADLRDCHMLFISADKTSDPHPYLIGVKRPVLKVGETIDFIKRGGIINLVRVENKFRFEINRSAGERAGFKFSSQLLKLATIVGDDN
jgi:hypothetical protein